MNAGARRAIVILASTTLFFAGTTGFFAWRESIPQKIVRLVWPGYAPFMDPFDLATGLIGIYRTDHATIVMLGDSITAGVDWNELLGRTDVVSRAIPGDTAAGMLARIDQVIRLHPRICLVMGGINDLGAGRAPQAIMDDLARIVDRLAAANIVPVLESVLKVRTAEDDFRFDRAPANRDNEHVAALDRLIVDYARRHGVAYLDLNAELAPGGVLAAQYTYDGVHLRAAAYRLWGARVEAYLGTRGL
ncbi:MAG TPA: GDSL-type esterase/lipase family protein [Alphaproteobacteria bacterium]|nr:GDSL-type esterase/lipase family protein [Alphaproteobacteria bacterium]